MSNIFIYLIFSLIAQAGQISQKKLNQSLIKSVRNGNLDNVKDLLSQGADINCVDELGDRPLTVAIENQNFNLVEQLLENSANVDATDGNRRTPLMLAMEPQDLRKKSSKLIFEKVLDHCPNLAIEDLDSNTALNDAVEANNCYYLQKLLERYDTEYLSTIKNKNGQNLTDLVLQEHDQHKTNLLCNYPIFKNQVAMKLISKITNIASQECHLSAEVISTLAHGLDKFPEFVKPSKKPRLEANHHYFI
jgi:ankyrin repeat protein